MTYEQDAAVERVMRQADRYIYDGYSGISMAGESTERYKAAIRTELTAAYDRGRASMYLTMQAYAWHNDKCTWFENDDEACTCGFDKIAESKPRRR